MSANDYTHTIENFFGVYLLYCMNEKYKGRTYIGFTVDPNRRIKQHNKGKRAGGAWKTSNRGPWEMVMIIHGFPNDVAALRFEWAWQHPCSSRRLKHVAKKKTREKVFDYCIRVLAEMLCVGPWNRLPLVIRWLNQDFIRDLSDHRIPPVHMSICYGTVISKKIKKLEELEGLPEENNFSNICDICFEFSNKKFISCLDSKCNFRSHLICLSKIFLEPGEYIPIEGKCPKCNISCLWGDLIKKYKGCYNNLDIKIDSTNTDCFYSDSD
ncbi:hypothetical protein WA026_021619 [Henosepilachna vigintioctopunctata]|uniref:Structure-specific endonuclease subunit SLX1 homolog n=1 Tax=Henosepilachna vigintioctopunctata TaxID=420089 RepID=A0AAW1V612_9CUCU